MLDTSHFIDESGRSTTGGSDNGTTQVRSRASERPGRAAALDPGYTCEFDTMDPDRWHESMLHFDDASFSQTWAFGAVHSGESHLRHAVLYKDDRVVSMAQVRVASVLGLPVGIAYVGSGPMWKRKDASPDVDHLRNMLRALRHEYVSERRYYLRIVPNLYDSAENAPLRDAFREEGLAYEAFPGETVLVDLSPPLDEIRRNLSRKWRQTLHSGEKKGLEIKEGSDETFCAMAAQVFLEMKERKKFFGGDQREAIEVHSRLPERLKLHFLACVHAGEPVAVLGCVTFGSTGLPVVSATGSKALALHASNVLWWKMIEYYKKGGFSALDTAGVNAARNPGGYLFKTHILGKRFKEPNRRLGQFDACGNALSDLLFRMAYSMRANYRELGRRLLGRRARPASDGADAAEA